MSVIKNHLQKPNLQEWQKSLHAPQVMNDIQKCIGVVSDWYCAQCVHCTSSCDEASYFNISEGGHYHHATSFWVEFNGNYKGNNDLRGKRGLAQHVIPEFDYLQRIYILHSIEGVNVSGTMDTVEMENYIAANKDDWIAEPGVSRHVIEAWESFRTERLKAEKKRFRDLVFGPDIWQDLSMACGVKAPPSDLPYVSIWTTSRITDEEKEILEVLEEAMDEGEQEYRVRTSSH